MNQEFVSRLAERKEELHQLYMELYGRETMFLELLDEMKAFHEMRLPQLKQIGRASCRERVYWPV